MKTRLLWMTTLAIFALSPTIVTAAEDLAIQLSNMRVPQPNRIVSGAIDAADLGRLRAAGVKHVINLRTTKESAGLDEAGIAAGLGLDYDSLPIEGAQSLTRENAARLDQLLNEAGDEPTLVHCGSGNRVGALIALRAAWIKGQPEDAAIAEGKRWGRTSLEGAVRSLLLENPSNSKMQ
jgi:uncharacterized protein (TIGR01244 family)